MIREFGGWGRCVLVRGMKRLVKSADSGLEWRWNRGCRGTIEQFLHFLFLWHMRATHDNGTGIERERRGRKRRGGREIDKRCRVPFVMVSYSIYRDQFRDLSVVSEFTVPREIGTLGKNVMCTHIRRRSSRTSRRRVRSRLDSLLGRW